VTVEPVPFTVDVPEEEVDALRRRLRDTRWADDFGNETWRYGVEREWLRGLVEYWADGFDWRTQEAAINGFPQFRVELDSVPVHFVHVRGKGPAPLPLVLTHGWPWTFWDWKDVIGPLADPAAHGGDPADAFDVVVPSLPGFGFSAPLRTTGITAQHVAGLWTRLMHDVLGYDRFCAGGGDWGAIVTGELGHRHAGHLRGVWLTLPMIPGVNLRELTADAFAADEQWMAERAAEARLVIQSHRTVHQFEPQTLAYALVDSPAGTAAWLWARRRDWSDCGGDPLTVFDRDFLCTTASIYWVTKTIGTSLRLYFEHFGAATPPAHDRARVIDVPTGFAVFPKELLFLPRAVAEERTSLRRWSVQPRGGHFAPSEQPALVVDELRAFFRDLR
jgi:pimeloyl-ACP methyl ester carboxylesterase